MSKLTMAAAAAVGYVLGSRAGRERYEQISEKASSLWNNPKVQEQATKAQDMAKEKGPAAKGKMSDTMGKVRGKAKDAGRDGGDGDTPDILVVEETVVEDPLVTETYSPEGPRV